MYLMHFICILSIQNSFKAQTFVFAQLNGSPNLNLTGWNLNGNAYVGDTPGDADNILNELILTNASGNQSGGVFCSSPMNPSICSKWTVEFEYRIWGGSAADGLAFCFLDVPPAGFVTGGGIGIPGSANGLKVILDTYNNCGGANPELQIYSGVGYNECAAGIVKVNNIGGSLNFVRSNSYQPVKITYANGVITLFINNTQYLTANFPINFTGYMGFTAGTGGLNDQHSIRNVIIYTDQATSSAGPDIQLCNNESTQIGVANNPNYLYSWSPTTGLNDPTISNPTLTAANSGSTSITQTYTVSTTLANNPGLCPTTDQVTVTVFPDKQTNLNASFCENSSYNFGNTILDSPGVYIDSLQTFFGCDSVVTLNLSETSIYTDTITAGICQGSVYNFGNQQLVSSGIFSQTYQSVAGCDSISTVILTVYPLPQIICPDTLICKGDSAILIPQGAAFYTWAPEIGAVSALGSLSATLNLTTNFILTGTDTNGCIGTETVTVNIQQPPTIQVSLDNSNVCAD